MRPLIDMETIQIDITNVCINSCSNCTRFCGHHKRPYFMSIGQFEQAVESMVGYPKMVGMMGGEPLLHPDFENLCRLMSKKIPKEQLGLWTCLPKGYEHHREIICETFGHLFTNDHSREDIFHAPILIASQEVIPNRREMFYANERCWVQNTWSASINPKGAFFCEVAASLSVLFNGNYGWSVHPGWWWRVTKDFREQIEEYCPKCGAALPLQRRRSTEGIDDISAGNLKLLEGKSKKIQKGAYQVSDLKLTAYPEPMGAYRDVVWRNRAAKQWGIYLHINEQKYLTPILLKRWDYAANS